MAKPIRVFIWTEDNHHRPLFTDSAHDKRGSPSLYLLPPGFGMPDLLSIFKKDAAFHGTMPADKHGAPYDFSKLGESDLDVYLMPAGCQLAGYWRDLTVDVAVAKPMDAKESAEKLQSLRDDDCLLLRGGNQRRANQAEEDKSPPSSPRAISTNKLQMPLTAVWDKERHSKRGCHTFYTGIDVFASLQVNEIRSIDSASQTFSSRFQLTLKWIAMEIKGFEFDKVDFAALKFQPDIKVDNAVEYVITSAPFGNEATTSLDKNTGRITHIVTYEATMRAAFDLHDFPFDTLNLQFCFSPSSHAERTRLRVNDDLLRIKLGIDKHAKIHDTLSHFDTYRVYRVGQVGQKLQGMASKWTKTAKEHVAKQHVPSLHQYISSAEKEEDEHRFNAAHSRSSIGNIVDSLLKSSRGEDKYSPVQLLQTVPMPDFRVGIPKRGTGSFRSFMTRDSFTGGKRSSEVAFYVTASRNSSFYVWNIQVFVTAIVTLSWTSLVIPVFGGRGAERESGLSDRLSVTLTLLLTTVAFKFVVAESLPKLSYLTALDKYMLINVAYLLLVITASTCIELESDPVVRGERDRLVNISLVILWVLIVSGSTLYFMWLSYVQPTRGGAKTGRTDTSMAKHMCHYKVGCICNEGCFCDEEDFEGGGSPVANPLASGRNCWQIFTGWAIKTVKKAAGRETRGKCAMDDFSEKRDDKGAVSIEDKRHCKKCPYPKWKQEVVVGGGVGAAEEKEEEEKTKR